MTVAWKHSSKNGKFVIILLSKLLTGISKMLCNSGEFSTSLYSKLVVAKINCAKRWQKTFYNQKDCLMYVITTIYKQVFCVQILYMLSVHTSRQASKSCIVFSTSSHVLFQKSKKYSIEFEHLKSF